MESLLSKIHSIIHVNRSLNLMGEFGSSNGLLSFLPPGEVGFSEGGIWYLPIWEICSEGEFCKGVFGFSKEAIWFLPMGKLISPKGDFGFSQGGSLVIRGDIFSETLWYI